MSAYFGKFNKKKVTDIQRKDVVDFLNEQAEHYSESSLRTMRTVLRKVLNFAVQNLYIERPYGWLENIPLAEAHGRKVVRSELTPEQSLGIISRLKEPWDTFALLIRYSAAEARRLPRCSLMISIMNLSCIFDASSTNAESWN